MNVKVYDNGPVRISKSIYMYMYTVVEFMVTFAVRPQNKIDPVFHGDDKHLQLD